MIWRRGWLRALAVALILGGCAAEVVRTGVVFQPSKATPHRVVELRNLVTLTLSTGYQRSLLTGSRWEHVGSVPRGDVYRPVGTVFTIEGANMHEAYLVIRGDRVVGFYLPGERSFSTLEPAVPITYKTLN